MTSNLYSESIHPSAKIHQTAVVDDGAFVGEGTSIWHFCHVMPGASIGKGCVLGQNVFVAATAVIGDNVKIQNNVSVYDGVVLTDDVFVGPSAVFTNVVNPRSAIIRKGEYQQTVVQKGASIGANATIICGCNIGRYAFIGAGSVVTKDVPEFALMLGVPAERAGWFGKAGYRLKEQNMADGHIPYLCPTGARYRQLWSPCRMVCEEDLL